MLSEHDAGDSEVQKSVAANIVSLCVNEGHIEKFCLGDPVPSPMNEPYW